MTEVTSLRAYQFYEDSEDVSSEAVPENTTEAGN